MSDLKLWTNGYDYVIAASEADARAVVTGLVGPLDEETFTLSEDIEQEPWTKPRTQTAAEWVRETGRGYLASSEA